MERIWWLWTHWFVNTVYIKVGEIILYSCVSFFLPLVVHQSRFIQEWFYDSFMPVWSCLYQIATPIITSDDATARYLHTFDFSMILLKWKQIQFFKWLDGTNQTGLDWFDLLRWFLITLPFALILSVDISAVQACCQKL
jgi:hypothetical protein